MTLLSRKADYALLILSHLHSRQEAASARELADQYQLSRPFVANILKELCHKGFVTSHRGVKGGYALARPVASISLAELMDSLDESFRLAECNEPAADHGCTLMGSCPLHAAMSHVHEQLRTVLAQVTLADLFRPGCRVPTETFQEVLATLPPREPCVMSAAD